MRFQSQQSPEEQAKALKILAPVLGFAALLAAAFLLFYVVPRVENHSARLGCYIAVALHCLMAFISWRAYNKSRS